MEVGDIVLGTVKEVTNTITSVILEDGSEGTIISSEIAPGRIKFMRQYVTPNKKIVCKVLSISNGNINLSLRRVTAKERSEVIKKYKAEHATESAFKQILGSTFDKVVSLIKKDFSSLLEFLQEAKDDELVFEKYIPEEKREAIKKISEKRRKSSFLKYKVSLTCSESDGVQKIKDVCDVSNEKVGIHYTSAGKFVLQIEVDDFKEGKKEANKLLEVMQEKAKKNHCEFSFTEEK